MPLPRVLIQLTYPPLPDLPISSGLTLYLAKPRCIVNIIKLIYPK
ncbi:hypothetical protein YPPY32_3987 [Yersinia pestis PY-32]|nr:hypothetical protein YPPY03_3761 [Yersinia pestis PY-03]EIR57371.1 hypothetical protein YPPY19_3687 [Yersinia pestis PY-19]EIR73873.1 hypothetical protein YPPY32_3987 [Yersinia pestis PY-32]EIR87469.1 hypothetical protein YPPY42_3735 [Yersinia pestis PY-42]EIT56708.1 hypothetical protein YPPY113_3807 [Yersinia pestis PY-113]